VLVNDSAYVVDCGDGVARQLVLAGVPLPSIRHIFLTHHHSDQMWIDAARTHFRGTVIVGKDLMEI
jgi:ribonuclease BN (tRNA processing enzyme)